VDVFLSFLREHFECKDPEYLAKGAFHRPKL
jgi:hypothetical protein